MTGSNPFAVGAFLMPYGVWMAFMLVLVVGGMMLLAGFHRDWQPKTKLLVKIGYLVLALLTIIVGVVLFTRPFVPGDPVVYGLLPVIAVANGAIRVATCAVIIAAAFVVKKVLDSARSYKQDVADARFHNISG